jgi:hypothetical protein
MSDRRVGRLLTASLHASIAELLPTRLEFYEGWLSPRQLRDGQIGLAPLVAVLSFLREEGADYSRVVTRAGECAAEWYVAELSPARQALYRAAPEFLRRQLAAGIARGLVRSTFGGSRVSCRWHKGVVSMRVYGSVFCSVQKTSDQPLCEFYAGALRGVMVAYSLSGDAVVTQCVATGAPDCVIVVEPKPAS